MGCVLYVLLLVLLFVIFFIHNGNIDNDTSIKEVYERNEGKEVNDVTMCCERMSVNESLWMHAKI